MQITYTGDHAIYGTYNVAFLGRYPDASPRLGLYRFPDSIEEITTHIPAYPTLKGNVKFRVWNDQMPTVKAFRDAGLIQSGASIYPAGLYFTYECPLTLEGKTAIAYMEAQSHG